MLRSVHAAFTLAGLVATACGGHTTPTPPSDDTLSFLLPEVTFADEADGHTGHSNHLRAALRQVKPVTDEFEGALYWPRRFIAALQQQRPREEQDGRTLTWSHTLVDDGWQINLRATTLPRGGQGEKAAPRERTFNLIVSGLRGQQLQIQDFEWMRGTEVTNDDEALAGAGSHGSWRIDDPRLEQLREAGDRTVVITWSRSADGEHTLMATDTSEGRKTSGDQVRFTHNQDIAHLLVRDARGGENQRAGGARDDTAAASFELEWNRHTGAGRWSDQNGMQACWEAKTAGQVDIPCPPGPWPPATHQSHRGAAAIPDHDRTRSNL